MDSQSGTDSAAASPSGIRPRRSLVTTDYSQFLKPPPLELNDSSSSSSSEDDDAGAVQGEGDSATASKSKGKGKGKARTREPTPASAADETDVSEYEDERETEKNDKGKGKGAASESDDEDLDAGESSESQETPSEDEASEQDLGSGTNSPDTKGRSRDKKPHVATLNTSTAPRIRIAAAPRKPAEKRVAAVSKRVQAPPLTPKMAIQPPAATDPPYEPPSRYIEDEGKSNRSSLGEGKIVEGPPVHEELRTEITNAWAHCDFGPERKLMADLGWWKGKWNVGKGKGRMSKRWGGWYPEVQVPLDDVEFVSDSDILPYLPRIVHLAQPSKINTAPGILAAADEIDQDEEEQGPGVMAVDDPAAAARDEEEDSASRIKVWIGPIDERENNQEQITLDRFESRRLDEFFPTKPGYVLNAGGPVQGLAWCPHADDVESPTTAYLAISTMSSSPTVIHPRVSSPSIIQIWSLDTSVPSDLEQSTSSKHRGTGIKLDFNLCIEVGEAWDLRWCPKGGNNSRDPDGMDVDEEVDGEEPKLGLLAGVFMDGSVSIFAVPDPEVVRRQKSISEGEPFSIRAEPVLRLEISSTNCSSLSWGSHETIAAGCANGAVAVWYIGDALRSGAKTGEPLISSNVGEFRESRLTFLSLAKVQPTHYFPVHLGAVSAVTFVLSPPIASQLDRSVDLDGEPHHIATSGHDGTTFYTDLRDPATPLLVAHDRGVPMAINYSCWTDAVICIDPDNRVRGFVLSPQFFSTTKLVANHRGCVWSIAASEHHPFIATSSADGTCIVANVLKSLRKRNHSSYFTHKLYRLDFNRTLGEYRMIDNIRPDIRIEPTKLRPKKGSIAPLLAEAASTGAWSLGIAVTKTDWHPNLRRSCLLASGTALGLVRVDWVERSWTDKRPYHNLQREKGPVKKEEEEKEGNDEMME